MNDEPARTQHLFQSVTETLFAFALIGGVLFAVGRKDYPQLHVILDTGVFLISAVLAWSFRDMGQRVDRPLLKWIAASFGITSLLELVHVLVTVEWSGALAPIAQAASVLRPSTWPPAAHLLPIGVGGAVFLSHSGGSTHPARFALALAVLAAGLLPLFRWLPQYTLPRALGITRPALVWVPLLWGIAGWACWRLRAADRILPALAVMAMVLFLANVSMLYSQAPHDTEAMVAHLGKMCGYLLVLLTMMRMASVDMLERIRAERELEQLNEILERRIADRTAQLGLANRTLEEEIAVRRQAEQKVRAQLERLSLLHQITSAIGDRQDLKSIFQIVVRSVEDDLPVEFSCICLREAREPWLTVSHVGGGSDTLAFDLALTEQARVVIDENGLSRCLRGELVYESDVSQVPMPFPQRFARGGLRAVVLAPLLFESQVFGLLVAARREPKSFVSGECEFLRQLSEHVALAAHQAQLHGALQRAYDDLRQTQQAVMQQERLRALGQMAGGIAHDINNAISPVALYTESLLETETSLSARARNYLETIQRAIDDVAKTVSRMREFYRQREPQLTLAPVRLNTLMQQVIDLTRARWSDIPQQCGSVIGMVTEFAPELPEIMGVENEIREALINLIFNAVDAMPNGGALTLRTRVVQGAHEPNGAPMPRRVHVEVTDTGVGMDEDTRRRCLEPFFTTKGERGTGLGLAMVYGVIQRHSADIEIESQAGRGTTMRLIFTVYELSAVEPEGGAHRVIQPSRQHILLVDDDPLLLKSLLDTLEGDGHRVVVANGGQKGIEAFEAAHERGEAFSVVITDLGMPHVDGRNVAAAVKAASPATPVILLTGWGQRLVDNGDVPTNVDRVLSKPPKLHALREALAHCSSGVTS